MTINPAFKGVKLNIAVNYRDSLKYVDQLWIHQLQATETHIPASVLSQEVCMYTLSPACLLLTPWAIAMELLGSLLLAVTGKLIQLRGGYTCSVEWHDHHRAIVRCLVWKKQLPTMSSVQLSFCSIW